MPKTSSAHIQDHFADLTDPRRRPVIYPLINVVTIAICAVICGADDFVAIAEFGRAKKKFLGRFLDLSAGIPSHDRFNAIFRAIKPAEFEKCLLSWITALHEVTDGQVVAIDGKTLRRSFDTASSKSAIHMVSAWATANHISLGQVVVDQKSNEITAIPKLLEILEISGALVTIDAMGRQTEIAHHIVESGADYVLAVKGNQPTLHDGLAFFFADHLADDFARVQVRRHETHEHAHDPRRQGMHRVSLLHLEQIRVWKAFCRGGAEPLGDRKPLALATRRDLSGRSVPDSQGVCGRQLQQPPPYRPESVEEQPYEKSGREEQTPRRSLER
jgi:predicted transposase YbfD/YdcC